MGSASSFRLGVRQSDNVTPALASPSLDPDRALPSGHAVAWGGKKGIATDFGSLLVGPDGSWALYDASNKSVLTSQAPPSYAYVFDRIGLLMVTP